MNRYVTSALDKVMVFARGAVHNEFASFVVTFRHNSRLTVLLALCQIYMEHGGCS